MPERRNILLTVVLVFGVAVTSACGLPAEPTPSMIAPPGLDATLLALRDVDDRRAWLEWDAALHELAAQIPEPPEAPPPIEPEPAAADLALRHYLAARDEMLKGRALVAISHLERARQHDPQSTSVLRALAHNFALLREPSRERAAYTELYRLDPADSEARFSMGLLALGQRDFRTAAALLSAVRVDDGHFDHDVGADMVADHALHVALVALGYDRAAIEAGHRATSDPAFDETTRYRTRVVAVMRDRGAIWRSIGDAYARLGEHELALEAWNASADFAPEENVVLATRRAFALQELGRGEEAEEQLLSWLAEPTARRRADAVSLAEYLVARRGRTDRLEEAVRDLLDRLPDDGVVAVTSAVVLDVPEAERCLASYVDAHPRDTIAAGRLMRLRAEADPAAAVDLALELVDRDPELADVDALNLIAAVPDALAWLGDEADPPSPLHVELAARVHRRIGGVSPAWWRCRRGLERWPENERLLRLNIELTGALDEPALLERAMEAAAGLSDVHTECERATALAAVEEFDEAVEAADRAASRAVTPHELRRSFETRVRTHAARAMGLKIDGVRQRAVLRTLALASEFLEQFPEDETPYELLATLHGPGGLQPDGRRYQEIVAAACVQAPDSALCGRLIAQEAINHGRLEFALERALPLVERDITDGESVGIAISAWQGLRRGADALAWLERLMARYPGDARLLDRFVRVMLAEQRGAEARAMLEERLAVDPGDVAAVRLLEMVHQVNGDTRAALALGQQRLDQRPEGTGRALQLALLLARAERSEAAVERLQWIADRAAETSQRHLLGAIGLAGRLEIEDERRDEILATLVERMVEVHPDTSINVYVMGLRALGSVGTTQRFRALAERAAMHGAGSGAPGSVTHLLAWRELAQQLIDAGQVRAASIALRTRLELGLNGTLRGATPLQPDGLALLVSMILAVDSQRPDGTAEGIDLLTDLDARGRLPALPAISGPPDLSRAVAGTAELFSLVGNRDGAEQMRRQALRLDPADGMTKNNLGYMLIDAGRNDPETVAWIEEAAVQFAEAASVVDTVGWLRYKQGHFADDERGAGALSLLRRAMRLADEDVPEMLDHYGDTLWRLGDHETAIDQWRRAAEVLDDAERREQTIRYYQDLQSLVWGLLVADPQAMYDREVEPLVERLQRKLDAWERGGQAPVAPTFDELLPPG